jgi:peptide/nickel transport system substrate-binding protein
MVVRAVYDTLTVPNAEGDYVPYLAESITHDDAYQTWDIVVREGVTFHDGTDLTAEVVKNNLDAYRGAYPGRDSLLAAFSLRNIESVEVTAPDTVQVKTVVPWVAFPAYLFGSSRLGIMAQAQLDDQESCARKPIGTGPFRFVSWNPNQKLVAERNEDYWQIAPDGEPYPYADSIEFRPITDVEVRNQAIESGDINVMHTFEGESIAGRLKDLRDAGDINLLVSDESAEISFIQMNQTAPPFDDIRMRRALALSADRERVNENVNAGLPTIADGPFAPDSIGYVEDPGFPDFDKAEAEKLVQEYVADGGKAEFTLHVPNTPSLKRLAELTQQRAKGVGVTVKIVLRDQASLINDAIGKAYQAMLFRNYPGGDPDGLYVWFYSGTEGDDGSLTPNLVNFAGIDDPEVDRLLDEGRSETDPAAREAIYQDLNRRMATQVYGIWSWYTAWAVAVSGDVHGILGPPLPSQDPSRPGDAQTDDPARQPNRGLATGHSLIGLWIE